MNRIITFLSLFLGLQLLVAAVLLWPRQDAGQGDALGVLLDIDTGASTRLVISDASDSVMLQRNGARWSLPEYHRLPVDPGKVDDLLQRLPGLTRGWPVTTSAAALERFEVADSNYQRQVLYFAENSEQGSVFLGTSPGFRKVHARPSGSSEVFSVEFNTFDLPLEASAWMDKTLLQLEEVQSVQGLDYSISLADGQWQDGEGNGADSATVEGLLNGLQSLRVSGVADIATADILNDTEVPPTLVVNSGDRRLEYRLYTIEDAYYVRRADIPLYFSLSALDHDRLNEVNEATLFPRPEAGVEAEAQAGVEAEAQAEAGVEVNADAGAGTAADAGAQPQASPQAGD